MSEPSTAEAGTSAPAPARDDGGRRPANRRDLILAAAIELFHERGYHATGVDDIGQAVDVSGPAIYRHFASKEDILLEAIRSAGDRVHAADEAARAAGGGPRSVVEGFVRAYARVAVEEAALMAVWTSEVRHLTPERRSPMTRRIRTWTDGWADVLVAWRPELDTVDARDLVTAGIGLITAVAVTCDPTDVDAAVDRIAAMAMAVFAADL